MEYITRAFIPFKNQDNKICNIVRNSPAYTSVLNQNIQRFKPPVSFDWGYEVSDAVRAEQDKRYDLIQKGLLESLSIPELQEKFKEWIGRFQPQRLIHLQPERLMYVNGTVGVECTYLGSVEDQLYLPQHVLITNYVFDLDYLHQHSDVANEIMYGSAILAFIAEPFNS